MAVTGPSDTLASLDSPRAMRCERVLFEYVDLKWLLADDLVLTVDRQVSIVNFEHVSA